MSIRSLDTFRTRRSLHVDGDTLEYFSLPSLEEAGIGKVSRLPFSLRVLLENLLRNEDGRAVTKADIEALAKWDPSTPSDREIAFSPARVILQDFTGVPAVVDLAVMRDAVSDLGGNPAKVNPHVPAELVIDHSVQVDLYGRRGAFEFNVDKEFERNRERYEFLRWGQSAFDSFKVVPPATGIVHQVNLEFLARVVFESVSGAGRVAFFDTLVGTDSHTTMINGLGVLGWGVGGIEAEAAMLGQPISLLIPQVVGFRLSGSLPEGATATDMVLTITQMLRKKGVVGKFVEFFGPGVTRLTLADRATIGNMSPEYGATCAIFPIDQETLSYLNLSARSARQISLVEGYSKAQGLFHTPEGPEPVYSDLLELDLGSVEPSLAGPRRPQDRIVLAQSKAAFNQAFGSQSSGTGPDGRVRVRLGPEFTGDGEVNFEIGNGAIVIAAITSCTNTSNPSVMIAAGLVAKKAVEKGLTRKPWVKSSLAPGSKVVTEYLEQSGLSRYLDELGFQLVGYGCTTCIGNSGPLPEPVSKAIRENNFVACAVLSGNRNFEGRINPDVRANYLVSPPLVVAYSLAGRMDIDLLTEALGYDVSGREVYLKDIWPTQREIQDVVQRSVTREMFASKYADVFTGDPRWQKLPVPLGDRYEWEVSSTYIRKPTFFENITRRPEEVRNIRGMRLLALLGDSVTTDHISPAGSIQVKSPAGQYLVEKGVEPKDFNSYGSRRGNHEVMVRGTFANIRLRNLLVPGVEGGYARHHSSDDVLPIYDVAMKYREEGVPLLIIAGKEYGSGSSRDWAAKGTRLLGIRAVIAESFERIHRSNLIGMGVLPCQFLEGLTWESLRLTGTETFDLLGLEDGLEPGKKLKVLARAGGSVVKEFAVVARVDTPNEVLYYQHGGILHYVLRSLVSD